MRYFFISILIILTAYLPAHKLCNCNTDPLLQELDQLAKANGMEFVIGSKFPVINPYGSYGSTYVFDFAYGTKDNPVGRSILFLCRKKEYVRKRKDPALDLVHNYRYFLVFATRMENENKFKVKDIIPDADLKGMSLYYGSLNIDLSKLEYVNKPDVRVPQDILGKVVSQSIPVLISAESSTQFLFYYQGDWLEYVERDI